MAGWDLVEGICKKESISEDEFWEIINNFFSSKSNKTTSYKFAFFKSIIDNIFNLDGAIISYDILFERFAEMYWNLVARYRIVQIQSTSRFTKSSVEIIIEEILKKYNLDKDTPFESLRDDIKAYVIFKITKTCSKYVIGAFFEDTDRSFYSFSRKDKMIELHPNIVKYIIKYKNILSKLNYFEWIKFLEKTNTNDNIILLAEKLDCSTKRGNLTFYKDFLYDLYNKKECFYCGKNLENKKIEMDHFIPWSYLKDDKLWNMVMSCRNCNNSKRDKLPDKTFIEKLSIQNNIIIQCNKYKSVEREYIGYSKEKLIKIYNSAIFNGFNEFWKPKGE